MFFKGKLQDEEGYVLYVRKNALQILIPKYGLECTLYLTANKDDAASLFHYDEEKQTQSCGNVCIHAFDPVTVRLSLDSDNIQHEKFVLQLVKPFIKGFSVLPLSETDKKRKSADVEKQSKKQKP